jgi:hypothetical protein
MERTAAYAINHWPVLSILNFAGEADRVRTGGTMALKIAVGYDRRRLMQNSQSHKRRRD